MTARARLPAGGAALVALIGGAWVAHAVIPPRRAAPHRFPQFAGTATRTHLSDCAGIVPARGQNKVTDCWYGHVAGQQRPFRLALWRQYNSQGITVVAANGNGRSYGAGPSTVYRFASTVACWYTQAGAWGGAVNLGNGSLIEVNGSPYQNRLFAKLCGAAIFTGPIRGLPGRRKYPIQ